MQPKKFWILLIGAILVLESALASAAPSAAAFGQTAPAWDAAGGAQLVQVGQTLESTTAATTTLYLRVVAARTEPLAFDGAGVVKGDPVTNYEFIINEDNAGDPTQPRFPDCYPYLDPPDNTVINPNYPAGCNWPSIRPQAGFAPIVTQGDETLLNETTGIPLPPGKYLISVLGDGYKIDGAHFAVPLEEPGLVTVEAQPLPLPAATIRIRVFEDRSTNGQFDAPAEQGLAGFRAQVADLGGEMSTDLFGNPLCTEYERDGNGDIIFDPEGNPIPIPGTGGVCESDVNGDIVIPNMSPNRFDVTVVPPTGTNWIQTTTLEGGRGWDTWLLEGGTGLDNEFVVAGEPFPWTIFGFVQPTNALTDTGVTGGIEGTIVAASVYVPLNGGLPYYGSQWGGLAGARITQPIENPWIALNDLQNGDVAVWVGQGNADGHFSIPHVPDGDYMLTYWDEPQRYILDLINVTVSNGQVVDVGHPMLTGWYAKVYGYVFLDENENGKRDPGEPGVPDYLVAIKRRENSSIDRGGIEAMTDAYGYYEIDSVYPLTQWIVFEAYNDRYRSTGITFQAENQPEETTVLGGGVDVNVLPIIGQSGRLDWGVMPYDAGTNGGIVGSVTYDSARNELDARHAGVEPWQPGIPGLRINLYAPVKDGSGNFVKDPDGAYTKGPLLNWTMNEQWVRPQNCRVRDADGNPIDQFVLPPSSGGYDCLEAPLTGMQFEAGFAAVDGNWGFGEILTDTNGNPLPEPMPIPPGDYLVEVVVPDDAYGRPLYQVTREEDINVFDGDQYVPQIPPPECAGPLHVVDVAGVLPDGPNAVENPAFAEVGGSPYEGMEMPLCNVKLVNLGDQRSVAPMFNLFTEVSIPGRWYGYIIDDLTLSVNREELFFGEKAGIPDAPVGIYDFMNRLVFTAQSDPNGVYEVLLPSTGTFNVPSPSGVAPNVYYHVGNDPGQIGHVNTNYNPQYRTIGASFELYPGTIIPADLAPTQIGVSILDPGSNVSRPAQCRVDVATPQLFAVSRPYGYAGSAETLTIQGLGFGATQGTGKVTLDDFSLPVVAWDDRTIVARVPATFRSGLYQLMVVRDNGQPLVNGLTYHLLGPSYNPALFEVGSTRPYTTVQSALDAAAAQPRRALVVVYPGEPAQWNPHGVYYENPVIYAPVKLQGIGPGGVYTDGTYVDGSVIDGRMMTGDTEYSTWWRTFVQGLDWDGNQTMSEGQVFYVLAEQGEFNAIYRTTVDGFTIQGGDQQGVPTIPGGGGGGQLPVEIQGGAFYVNGYARYFQISNNVIRSNGGSYGAIRIGTPDWGDSHNEAIRIVNNQILANGGVNLAGAVGIFQGADNYEVAYNHFCGNFSAEYGGAISHYGFSSGGRIHHNRIYFNRSYDEGGGIMIAGELPVNPGELSPGAGPVDIYNNIVQSNLANDDGGGIRFLMAGNFEYNVYNNLIANNISTHEGGGISLNDAPAVRVYNNTIMRNLTTATALTSNGEPAPAGLSTSMNSAPLQAALPPLWPPFSSPLLFNNVFWDNRAGRWTGASVDGIGLPGDPNSINHWDLGVAGTTYLLDPTYSMLQVTDGTVPDPTNQVGVDPLVVQEYTTTVAVLPWRGNPNFVGVLIVALDLPPTLMGDYHLAVNSTAIDTGAAIKWVVAAPPFDIDDDPRPSNVYYDIGSDEVGPNPSVAVVLPGTAFGGIRFLEYPPVFLPLVIRGGS